MEFLRVRLRRTLLFLPAARGRAAHEIVVEKTNRRLHVCRSRFAKRSGRVLQNRRRTEDRSLVTLAYRNCVERNGWQAVHWSCFVTWTFSCFRFFEFGNTKIDTNCYLNMSGHDTGVSQEALSGTAGVPE